MICQVPAIQFKLIIDSLKDILTQCWLVFRPEGFFIRNVDPEKVVLVGMLWKPVEQYECTHELAFSFYIQTLYRILRSVRRRSTILLESVGPTGLQITILTDQEPLYRATLHSLPDPAPRFMESPLQPLLEVCLPTAQVYRMLHDLTTLSRTGTVEIRTPEQQLVFAVRDVHGTQAQFFYPLPTPCHEPFCQTYLLKYLEKFTKPVVQAVVTIRLFASGALRVRHDWDSGYLELSTTALR